MTPSTEIEGNAIPKIPSNLEAKKASPSNFVASPKVILTAVPATETTSLDKTPEQPPVPYLISNLVPF